MAKYRNLNCSSMISYGVLKSSPMTSYKILRSSSMTWDFKMFLNDMEI